MLGPAFSRKSKKEQRASLSDTQILLSTFSTKTGGLKRKVLLSSRFSVIAPIRSPCTLYLSRYLTRIEGNTGVKNLELVQVLSG